MTEKIDVGGQAKLAHGLLQFCQIGAFFRVGIADYQAMHRQAIRGEGGDQREELLVALEPGDSSGKQQQALVGEVGVGSLPGSEPSGGRLIGWEVAVGLNSARNNAELGRRHVRVVFGHVASGASADRDHAFAAGHDG